MYQIDEKGVSSASQGRIAQPLPTILLTAPKQLQNAYNFVVLEKGRISGRPATKIRIVSKDNSRFTHTLWLDAETSLMLQLRTHDAEGSLREQLQITSLDIASKPLAFFSQFDLTRFPEVRKERSL